MHFGFQKRTRNQFIERVLKRFGYAPHGRADKGVLLRCIERMTGLSRQQVTRLVGRYRKDGKLSKQPCKPKQGFAYRYTAADVALLAETDVLHGTLSGPATKKLMERAYQVFGDPRYERLAGISVCAGLVRWLVVPSGCAGSRCAAPSPYILPRFPSAPRGSLKMTRKKQPWYVVPIV